MSISRTSFVVGSLLSAFLVLAATPALSESAAKDVEVPVIDMRQGDVESAHRKALKLSDSNGITIVYHGAEPAPERAVHTVASECADQGFQVRALILAPPGGGEGMVLYGAAGGPLGPLMPVSADLKSLTTAQMVSLKERLERSTAGTTAAVELQDVVRCRYIAVVGSRVRKEKVCTSARQDEEVRKDSKEWTRRIQDRGANEAMPGGG